MQDTRGDVLDVLDVQDEPDINYNTSVDGIDGVDDINDENMVRSTSQPIPGSLEEQLLSELRDSYTNTDERATAITRLQNLDKKLRSYLTRFIPNGIVPIFVTPAQTDAQINSEFGAATWSEYSTQDDTAGVDDNYCRKMESGDWYYPRRNTVIQTSDQVELANCGQIMNEEVNQIADINTKLPTLITRAKLKYIKSDTSPNDAVNNARTQLLQQVQEYETIHSQYLQLVKNVNANTDILKRRTKTINKDSSQLSTLENNLEIQKSIFNDWTAVEDDQVTRNQLLLKIAKIMLWGLWILMFTLILLANTSFVIQN